MNSIKKYAGIIWMILGPLAIYWLLQTALHEIALKPHLETKIQWGVFVIVFLPIAIGMMIFGWYALKGEYDQLPGNSAEL